MTQLIAFSGKIASGKSTTARHINSRFYQGRARHTSFASPLRDEVAMLMRLYSPNDDQFYHTLLASPLEMPDSSNLLEKFIVTTTSSGLDGNELYRLMMQSWGTDVRRADDPYYWVKRTMNTVRKNAIKGVTTIIDDCRFTNEADAILSACGVLIRLDIDPQEQLRRLTKIRGISHDNDILAHPSETQLDDYQKFSLRVDNTNPEEAEKEILSFLSEKEDAAWERSQCE